MRAVGELIQNQFRIGLLRMERVVRERMTIIDPDQATPSALINIRPVVASMKEFFGGSQLSQFMDQTNPLAELTHKRRLSALGPWRSSRDRAGFDVRDVHYSHYGRICPIETPEGPNIGLIGSLATYGVINPYGFIETPYRRVIKELRADDPAIVGRYLREDVIDAELARRRRRSPRRSSKKLARKGDRMIRVRPFVSSQIEYLAADTEDNYVIAQANALIDENNHFIEDRIEARDGEHFMMEPPDKVEWMDVSPKQILSVATSLIPFLEHNDAPRALMGSNMQRQAVPLVRPETPIVDDGRRGAGGAGLRPGDPCRGRRRGAGRRRADHPRAIRQSGEERELPADEVRALEPGHVHQPAADDPPRRPRAAGRGAGRQLFDRQGRTRARPERARRLHVVGGLQLRGRDHPLGSRSCATTSSRRSTSRSTRSRRATPSSGRRRSRATSRTSARKSLRDLDENGIIRIGAEVNPGDILVGKITPKGETELTAEEKLLRAIFGEKAREVKDTSLRVPHGERGKVIDVKVFRRDDARRAAGRREQARARFDRPEAQGVRGRQDGGPPRQQGRHRAHPARRGHAVPRGRDAGGHHPEPDRRAEPHERRPGARNAPRLGGERAGLPRRDAGVRRRQRPADRG